MDSLKRTDLMEDELIEIFGKESLFDELTRAMSYDEKENYYKYIARMHDVTFSFEEDYEV